MSRTGALAEGFRAEIARRGFTAAAVDSRLGWPEGRTERLLAEPSELCFFEAELLSEELGTSADKVFETPARKGK